MRRWTWGWISCLVVLVGLVLTVPANAVGPGEGTQAPWSVLGLRRDGDPEALVALYEVAMVVVVLPRA